MRPDSLWGVQPVAALLTALLTGCVLPPAPVAPAAAPPPAPPVIQPVPLPPPPPAVAPQHAAVEFLLGYSDKVLSLPGPELTAEIAQLSESTDDTPQKQLQLALALGQTRQAVDTARALGLVQRVLGSQATEARPLHPLARLIENKYLQQRRLEEQMDRQTQQLREAQRRNDQLNDRLEAMRAIERSLNTRPPASRATPPAGR